MTQPATQETAPLLRGNARWAAGHLDEEYREANLKARRIVWWSLTVLFVVGLILMLAFQHWLHDSFYPWLGLLPRNPKLAASAILSRAPVIDGHIDLPILVRALYGNNVSAVDLNDMPEHVDIPRLRRGKVGGFFWSAYVPCASPDEEGDDFLTATWRVRDTLEQIDVAKLLISKYPDTFQLALSVNDIKSAIVHGKIASLLGVEGGHQLGNSISVLRQYHALGVRYLTLTHTCHNAFADSAGFFPGIEPLHHGLSSLGRRLIDEMNRLGVIVDLSHTSDATAEQALRYSDAPVIWSHSSSRSLQNVPRNVPDWLLRQVGTGEGKKDALIMVNFAPYFIAEPGKATLNAVADHIEHIANVTGRKHVGLGSDYDGISETPDGLEDVSKYPDLIAEMYRRGWSKMDIAGLAGANLLRILDGVERVAKQLAGKGPVVDLYKKRTDIPL